MNLFGDSGSSSDRRILRRGLAGALDDVNDMVDDAVDAYATPLHVSDLVPGSAAAYNYAQNNQPATTLPGPTPEDPAVPMPAGVSPLPPLPPLPGPDAGSYGPGAQGTTGRFWTREERAIATEPPSSGGALATIGAIALGGFLLLRRSK